MRGSYYIKIKNNRISYDIVLKRCITIIKGSSGTGKTNLINMLQLFIRKDINSGVSVSTNIKTIRVLDDSIDWRDELNKYRNSVFFVDEEVEYVLQRDFANLLYETGSYLVYITRSGLTGFLTYSISDVYEFKSKKDNNIYINKLYNIYNNEVVNFTPDLLLTEDSTSGKDILEHSLNVEVQSSFGKDNIVNKLYEVSNKYINIYIFVDGAAFGNQIQFLFAVKKTLTSCNILIFAPESFEYLILNTSKFKKFCEDELINTINYVDNSEFKTWENYFEYLLNELCKKYNHVKYEKVHWDKLNSFFKNESLLKEITDQFVDLDDSIKKFK